MIKLIHGNCLNEMTKIAGNSIDLIFTDLPYGSSNCKWDVVIPFENMWKHLLQLSKTNCAMIFTGTQPFTSLLINSNLKLFKYCLVWQKTLATNFFQAKKRPLKKHEDIIVFYQKQPTYNPQMTYGKPYKENKDRIRTCRNYKDGPITSIKAHVNYGTRYPSSVQLFSNGNNCKSIHPTEKPIALCEYIIKTYSNENDLVLDFTMGSGTTGIACKNLNRNFIGIELNDQYFEIAKKRIEGEL